MHILVAQVQAYFIIHDFADKRFTVVETDLSIMKRKRVSEKERFQEVDDDFMKEMVAAAGHENTKMSDKSVRRCS